MRARWLFALAACLWLAALARDAGVLQQAGYRCAMAGVVNKAVKVSSCDMA